MGIGRRDFFKVISAGAVTAATSGSVIAREKKKLVPNAVGILYDATLCIGCKTCEYGCKEYKNMPIEQSSSVDDLNVPKIWDNAEAANDYVELYHDGTNSYIINNTGDLYIGDAATDDIILQANSRYRRWDRGPLPDKGLLSPFCQIQISASGHKQASHATPIYVRYLRISGH